MRYLNGCRDRISVCKKPVISHLNSFPIMEFNYDYSQRELRFQEFEKNISGI